MRKEKAHNLKTRIKGGNTRLSPNKGFLSCIILIHKVGGEQEGEND